MNSFFINTRECVFDYVTFDLFLCSKEKLYKKEKVKCLFLD